MVKKIEKQNKIEEEDIIEDYIDLTPGGYDAMQKEIRLKDKEKCNKDCPCYTKSIKLFKYKQ